MVLEASRKLLEKTMRNSVEKERKWELKGSPKIAKINKKGYSEHALFLMGALGCPGGPRDHFLIDFCSISNRF